MKSLPESELDVRTPKRLQRGSLYALRCQRICHAPPRPGLRSLRALLFNPLFPSIRAVRVPFWLALTPLRTTDTLNRVAHHDQQSRPVGLAKLAHGAHNSFVNLCLIRLAQTHDQMP